MSNANILYSSFVKAEAAYRAERIHDDIVGRRQRSAVRRARSRRRGASAADQL
jgi:hypothetical protein